MPLLWVKLSESRADISICRQEDGDAIDAVGAAGFNTNRKEVYLMPGFDGTGPQGDGPMTGGARGYCNPGYRRSASVYGHGYGMGRGFRGGFGGGIGQGRGYGRGMGRRGAFPPAGGLYDSINPYGNPYSIRPEDELGMLKDEAAAIKSDLEAISKRIQDLESQS